MLEVEIRRRWAPTAVRSGRTGAGMQGLLSPLSSIVVRSQGLDPFAPGITTSPVICILTSMTPSSPLSGQVAVVTGASRGIGEAISHSLAALGAFVILAARDEQALARVQAEIESSGARAAIAPLDLCSAEQINRLGERIRAEHGRCDILVNNAGIGLIGKPLHQLPLEDWQQIQDTNLRAPYLLIRALAPLMIEAGAGHIINICSLAGHNPLANGAAYSASKWGLNGLTYSVAEELRPYGVKVAVIAPGSVNTHFGSGENGERKLQPADLAHVVAMLVTQAHQSFVSEVLVRPLRKA